MGKEQGGSTCLRASNADSTAEGAAVLQEVEQMTGLSQEYLNAEISELLGTTQDSVNNLSLDQLRLILLNYLETVNEEMTQELDRH